MNESLDRIGQIGEEIENSLADLPILEYGFLHTGDITFTERVRAVCRIECGRYGTSWSCPPAVGSVEECKERCLRYPVAFFFSTVHEIKDSQNLTESFQTKVEHEKLTDEVEKRVRDKGYETYRMSGDSCSICQNCAYPKPCRFPDQMHPCIESHGIVVAALTETCGMDYYIGEHDQLWFSLILLRKKDAKG